MGDFWLLCTNVVYKSQIQNSWIADITHENNFLLQLISLSLMGAIAHKFEFWLVYIYMIRGKMQNQINLYRYLLLKVALATLRVDVRFLGLYERTV